MGACDEKVRELAAEHRGVEVKGTGDGLMLAFQSARRAVTCAIEIQRALGQGTEGIDVGAIQLRLGLDTGEVIEGSCEPCATPSSSGPSGGGGRWTLVFGGVGGSASMPSPGLPAGPNAPSSVSSSSAVMS